jgi:hypothetical protein
MPPPVEFQVECQRLASGFFGTAISLVIQTRNGFWISCLHLLCGTVIAKYLGPPLADFSHLGISVSSFLAGLFGLAVLRKIHDMLEVLDAKRIVSDVWTALMDRIRGK